MQGAGLSATLPINFQSCAAIGLRSLVVRRLLRFKMLPYEWGEIAPISSHGVWTKLRIGLREKFREEVECD